MARVILVSNRLPVTIRQERAGVVASPSAGGLATGLRGVHERSSSVWIGWPGDVSGLGGAARASLGAQLDELRCVPVYLTPSEIARYYDGFANGVLWPLFHYQLDRIPVHRHDWDVYRQVNEKMADAVAAQYQGGDLVWVHDYQLMLVPAMVRARIPNAKIGFFLHIPFPASEVLRTLPWREDVLAGLLGADVVGVHTLAYRKHFISAVERILGIATRSDRVQYRGRDVVVGAFPMGIDVERWQAIANNPSVEDEALHVRRDAGNEKIMLGVDRLDYTKGIVRRLVAFERMLERNTELRGAVRFIQVAVPSRDGVASYQAHRREINEHVGRINGQFATVDWVPIRYVHRPFSEHHLVALYRAADVMAVTPLRDGMNLIAKEFVACRSGDDGVLVLSEFAGAAADMSEALIVNPYDVESLATAFRRALRMPDEERRFRMRALRERVAANDVHRWAQSFLDAVDAAVAVGPGQNQSVATEDARDALVAKLVDADRLLLLLDYDGTLVPFAAAPDLAAPDAELLELLRALAARPATDVHIVSGRRRDTLERWLGELPLALHAEHGLWSRPKPNGVAFPSWAASREMNVPWKTDLRALLERFTLGTPGAMVEEKTASLAWHYRLVEPELAAQRVDEVRGAIEAHIRGLPLSILGGDKVIEVRLQGVTKAAVVAAIADETSRLAIAAIGDDQTDEELFRALPADAVTISVGAGVTSARYRVDDVAGARAFLASLAAR
jgi:trehalose 6-phosphate synthase/phosphatase